MFRWRLLYDFFGFFYFHQRIWRLFFDPITPLSASFCWEFAKAASFYATASVESRPLTMWISASSNFFSLQIFSIWQLFVLVGCWVTLKLTPLVSQLELSPKAWGTIDLIAVCWIPFESPLLVQYHMKNFSLNNFSLFWDKGEQLSNFSFWPRLCMYKLVVRDLTAWLAQLGERRSAEQEVTGSNPGRTNTQGL